MMDKLIRSVADYRYRHALLVAETATVLASYFNVDIEKAWIAGLLHDCARGFNDEPDVFLKLAKEAGIAPTQNQLTNPSLFLHAPLSAYVAKRDYQVSDVEILNAIRLHQTGDFMMTKLDKIIYISDWIEPDRKNMEKYRNLAKIDLDEAFFQIYAYSIAQVIHNEWNFFENASDIYNTLWIERNKN